MFESIHPVEYDSCGRMKYNPDLHDRQGKPWEDDEIEYLINWYSKIGIEEMSLALGRTEGTIAQKVNQLRSKGNMSYETRCNAARELKSRSKSDARHSNPGRQRKFNVDIEVILKLKETKTYKQIAEMFNVSIKLIELRIKEYKKATKNPDQSVQSSKLNNPAPLYHMEGGMQVAQ